MMNRYPLIFFLLASLLYVNTLGHEFVLDDKIVITHNEFTKKGLNGLSDSFFSDSMTGFFGKDKKLVAGGRYRPLTMAVHAVQYEFFGNNPLPYHLMNILLYGLIGALVFKVLSSLFPEPEGQKWYSISVLSSLLFIVHPLHTEVVANIKSLDELMSIALALFAWFIWIKSSAEEKLDWKTFLAPAVLMFLSLLSKESSIAFILVIPLSGFMLLQLPFKKLFQIAVPLFIAAIAYVTMRYAVIGSAKLEVAKELMNNPFLYAETSEKFATIFLTYFEYFRLLVFPNPLTHDYYPKHIPIVDWSNLKVLLSLGLHLGLIVLAIIYRRNRLFLFWLVFYFANFFLYSNLLFSIGTFMNERFLFVSSLAFAFMAVYVLQHLLKENRKLVMVVVIVVGAIYSMLTVNRNKVWASDRSLAITDVQVSENSAKAQMAAGSAYLEMAGEPENTAKKSEYLEKSINHLSKSLQIHPKYFPPMILMGNALAKAKRFKESLIYYRNCLKLNPGHKDASNNVLYVAQQSAINNEFETAVLAYDLLLSQQKKPEYYSAIGEIYGKNLQDLPRSFDYLKEGLKFFPDNSELNQKAGVVMAMQGRASESLEYFNKALVGNPQNAHLLLNIGLAYRALGQLDLAEEYIGKAVKLDPSLRKG